jgi:hypothetical protein
MNWTHDSLVEDLAGHLKSPSTMTWEDMQLGPSGTVRPDVFLMTKSFAHPYVVAYECKISRSDFLSDVTSGKWSGYLKYAYGVIFAVPAGMVDKKELPDKCGLIVRHDAVWRLAKKPIIEPHPIPESAWRKLLIDGIYREGPIYRRKSWHSLNSDSKFNKKFGEEAARWIQDSASVKGNVERAREEIKGMYKAAEEQRERMRNEALREMPRMWDSLIEILEIDPGADRYAIKRAISELRMVKENSKQKTALRLLESISHQIDNLRDHLKPDPDPNDRKTEGEF